MSTHDEPVGSLGSEAAQLFEALQDWARDTGGDVARESPWGAEHIATGSAECTYCPLCRVISALRDDPVVRRQVTTAVTSVVDVVVGLLAEVGGGPHKGPDESPDEGPDESPEHDADDDDDDDDDDEARGAD